MLAVLGWACVAWTGLELVRLWQATRLSLGVLRAEEADSASRGRHPNTLRFAAWDEYGHPIVVDDLGHG